MNPEAKAAVPDVVKAKRFEVVDAAGETRAVLGALPDGHVSLTLGDVAGKARAGLTVRPEGSPGLTLYDAAGKVIWKAP